MHNSIVSIIIYNYKSITIELYIFVDKKKGSLLIVSCHINRLENIGLMTVLYNYCIRAFQSLVIHLLIKN